ncbi:hypothetical protein [Streptomyces sp. HB132]|uniref:hypothetical protein n=1 Tax=Streptomyces sp. HB132 TaxID=767388 RepID=UPI00195F8150|nr:hypothetical protein [Streptomyces sp. HB132]MBM7439985.1 hypothetical protein [Streptomyces sp. HB132]
MPLTASLKVPPSLKFWIYDDRRVVTETWHAELWLDDADTLALYARTRTPGIRRLRGRRHNVITAARPALNPH